MDRFFRHPWLIIAIIFVITLFFGYQLPFIEIDNNNLRFVPDNDPSLMISRDIDATFGSSLFILVGLERKYGSVFEPQFLDQLRAYVETVEESEIVKDINSLVTTDYITAEGDSLVVMRLVDEDFTGTPAEIEELKRRVLSWNLYEKALISDDFTATQILIPLSIESKDAGNPEVINSFLEIRDLAHEMFSADTEVYVTGMPVISATVNEEVNRDLRLLVPLVIAVVLVVLFFSFYRFIAVVLPLLTVLIATIWSIGAMPLFGIKLSVIGTVLPVIMVAVGSAYGIHVVTYYIAERGLEELSLEEHREFVFSILRKITKPVFLAAFTTFAGFVSLCFTVVVPIQEFGYFASFGVLVSFGIAITLIPALLIIRGPKALRVRRRNTSMDLAEDGGDPLGDPLSDAIADTFLGITRKERSTVFCFIAIAAVALYGLSLLVIDNILVEYFKPNTDIYRSDQFIRDKFGGSKVVNVVVEADTSEILLHPSSLSALDNMGTYLENRISEVGKVMGFTDLVKRINQVFNANESPHGLSPRIAESLTGEEAAEFGFGFFGQEGSFGFGDSDFEAFGFAESTPAYAMPLYEERDQRRPGADMLYTQDDLFMLLDSAGSYSRTMDVEEFIWQLKKQVNYEGAAYYEIPVNPDKYGKQSAEELQALIANYLVLLSGSISSYANDPLEPTAIRSTIQLRTLGEYDSNIALNEISRYIQSNFPSNTRVTVGGIALVEFSLNKLVVQSQITSVIISILLVFIIIAVSNKSLVAGCIGIAPLSISILINFAIMGFAGIKLNIGTAMVASVSVGIGIDYTIHYMEAYKREIIAMGGKGDFLRRTFATSGKAIIINAVSVGAGFAVLIFSRFNILANLGLLITLTMFTSAINSLTIIPVLLNILKPKFIWKQIGNPRA